MQVTGEFFRCPVCDKPNKVLLNNKGHIQAYCRDCHTVVFINRPAAVELANFKGRLFTNKAVPA